MQNKGIIGAVCGDIIGSSQDKGHELQVVHPTV